MSLYKFIIAPNGTILHHNSTKFYLDSTISHNNNKPHPDSTKLHIKSHHVCSMFQHGYAKHTLIPLNHT